MESAEDDCYGPALPPHMKKPSTVVAPPPEATSSGVIGPALPLNFKVPEITPPTIDPHTSDSESDSEDDVGPMPLDSDKVSRAQLELEERALEYQIMGIPSSSSSKNDGGREEWMIELPEVKKVTDLGLGARQFRASEGPDFSDRSQWTDTPNTVKVAKPKEDDTKGRMAYVQERARDKAMEKMKRKHEKKHKRDKSLLELHEKKLKKKKVCRPINTNVDLLFIMRIIDLQKKHKDEKPERRPFSRDTDLSTNKIDEAKRKAAIKNSSLLNNRFSSGSSKFL